MDVVLGVDIGTSSSKGVLVALDGEILATAVREHSVDRPHPGWVEMDAEIWWTEFREITAELVAAVPGAAVGAVGVSGMGPCVLLTDAEGAPLRPAILYGVDMRATEQIAALTDRLGGAEVIRARCGSGLSTQAAGPKLAWVAEQEPEVAERARMLLMPASFLVHRLTGAYVLDRHSASQCTPLFDAQALDWYRPWAEAVAPWLTLPELRWPGEVAGTVTEAAAAATGLPAGVPVITGTIDAWSEALSVDAHNPGDLMLMYGTTMFLVNTVATEEPLTSPVLWGTVGALPGTRNLAGGTATSGAITRWLRDLVGGTDYATLTEQARTAGPGGNGLLLLPYFAGERTPIQDPDARGVLAGLTVTHTRGDLYRAVLEATAYAVRHNIEALRAAGGQIDRVVAVGGGATGDVWTQIVTDVTGCTQVIPTRTIGASYGAAWLAASVVGEPDIRQWNPVATTREPSPANVAAYDHLYGLYRRLHAATADVQHELAELQTR